MPILVISLILLVLEASQSRQCFFEISSMPYGHRVGTNKIRTDPPIVAVHTNFFCSNVVRVILVRQFVHLTTHFFSATQFKHASGSLSGFSDLSEEPSSSCKPFSSISWERDVSPLTTNTSSVLSGFPIDHRLVWVLVGLVGRTLLAERCLLNFSTRLLNEFTNWLLFNC